MKKILFYYPSNKRTISIESVILAFKEEGHNVILLTHSEEHELHEELKKHGISTYSYNIKKDQSLLFYLKHLVFLVKFCKINNIDIVYSHLQQANIISVFAQYFCKSKFYICRHHSSVSGEDNNFFQSMFDRIINKLARIIIVPSSAVYRQLHEVEKVNKNKIKLIYYGYDFNKYPLPNMDEVEKIRTEYKSKLLLVKVARLVPGKRYFLLFEVIKKLILEKQLDVKLLVISEGPLFIDFQNYIKQNNLQNNIFLLGNKANVIDYITAADVVPLLSEAEASNSVIKEAGLVKKAVIICDNVGDFGDYIIQDESGLFMNKENPSNDLYNYLSDIYSNKYDTNLLGKNLHSRVINMFSIDRVISNYNELNA